MRMHIALVALALSVSTTAAAETRPCTGRLVHQDAAALKQTDPTKVRRISAFRSGIMSGWNNGSMTLEQQMQYVVEKLGDPKIDRSNILFLELRETPNSNVCVLFAEK